MTLRLMQLSDYPQLVKLWQPERMVTDYDYLEKVLAWNPNTCFVIEENGCILAATCGLYNGRHGILSSVAVLPSARKQGYGKLIVETTVKALKEQGCQRIRLFVAKHNEQALGFYYKLGFSIKDDAHYLGLKD